MRSTTTALLLGAAVAGSLTVAGLGLDRSAHATDGHEAQSMAVVDTVSLLEQMLQSDTFDASRAELEADFTERFAGLQQTQGMLMQQLQTMDQTDPQFQGVYAQWQGIDAQMQQLNGEYGQAINVLGASQAIEIYAQISAAVDAVAARESIDHVISNRSAPDATLEVGIGEVIQQILARPLISTSAVDLTAAVRDELGLPDPAVVAAEAEAAAAAAAAETAAAEAEAAAETAAEPAADSSDDTTDSEGYPTPATVSVLN